MSNKDEAKVCYSFEDTDIALGCVKKMIKESKDECHPRLVLLVQENCDGCEEEKTRFKKDVEEGTIIQIDINSEEGKDIAKRNEVEAVPALLLLDCKNDFIDA
ncbi:MAG: hypothetical protein V1767_00850 [Chloroflexota bacterium]